MRLQSVLPQIGNLWVILFFILGFTAVISSNISESAFATQSTDELFVSAATPMTNNYFAGPQVVEVIVKNPSIQDTSQVVTEPDVQINGKPLRMAQATDGYWYAFFADSKQAQIADSTQPTGSGKGLDFGMFCSSASAINATGVDFSNTKGVAIPRSAPGATNGFPSPTASISSTCSGLVDGSIKSISGSSILNHVVRKAPSLNQMTGISGGKIGQIGINPNAWPVIQLFDFSTIPTSVSIVYSNTAVVNLTFDRIPENWITIVDGGYKLPPSSPIFVNIKDPTLIIDPTDKNSWTWGSNSNNNTLYYQAFDENGKPDADGTLGMQNLIGNHTALMFNRNGPLTLQQNALPPHTSVLFRTNGLQTLNPSGSTASISADSGPITFLQSDLGSNIFANYDSSSKPNLITGNDPYFYSVNPAFIFKYNDANLGGSISLDGKVSCTGFTPQIHYPVAFNESLSSGNQPSIDFSLFADNCGTGQKTYSIVSKPSHGIITNFNATSGQGTYITSNQFFGNDYFTYKINDGMIDSNIATASVSICSCSYSPIVNAGKDQTVKSGSIVTLDGSKSYAVGGIPLTYSWQQTAGPTAILSNKTTVTTTFTAPSVSSSTQLTFLLSVSKYGFSKNQINTTSVNIVVQPNQNATISSTQSIPNQNIQNNTSITPQSQVSVTSNQTNHQTSNPTSNVTNTHSTTVPPPPTNKIIPPTNNVTDTHSTTVPSPPTNKVTSPTSNVTNTQSITSLPPPITKPNTPTTQSNTSSTIQHPLTIKPMSSVPQSTSKNPVNSDHMNGNNNHQPQQNSSNGFQQFITKLVSELKTLFAKIPG